MGRVSRCQVGGHQLGVENWAAIASLAETCKMLDIEPYAYLSDVLARIITRSDADPIDDLLLYNWVDSRAATTAVIEQAA